METVAARRQSLPDCGLQSPPALILAYHRVTELPSDPQLLCVRPRHFAEHLEVLRSLAQTVLPCGLLAGSRTGKPLVALTFDDGYADVLEQALPLLQWYQVPATVFVVTGDAGRTREFWWDELERLLLSPGAFPRILYLKIGVTELCWDLDGAAVYTPADCARFHDWNINQPPPTSRHALYLELYRRLRPLAESARNAVLDELWRLRDAAPLMRPTHRALLAGELCQLAASGLVDVGAHTVSHPLLRELSPVELEQEIGGSRRALEQILKRPVTAFAYPYGGRHDYNAAAVAAVREAGFTYACSTQPGRIGPDTAPLELPRLIVRDWDGKTFRRRLRSYLRL